MSWQVPPDSPIAPELIQNENINYNWFKRLQWAYRHCLSYPGPESEYLLYSEIGKFANTAKQLLVRYIENGCEYTAGFDSSKLCHGGTPFDQSFDVVDGIAYIVIKKGAEWKYFTRRFRQIQRLLDGIWSLGRESKFHIPFEAIVDHNSYRLIAQPLLPKGDNILEGLSTITQISNTYLKHDIAEQLIILASALNIELWPTTNPPGLINIEGFYYIKDIPKDASKTTKGTPIPHFLNFARDEWDIKFIKTALNVSMEAIKNSSYSNSLFPDVKHLLKIALSMSERRDQIKVVFPYHTWLFDTSIKLMNRYASFDQSHYMIPDSSYKINDFTSKAAIIWQSHPYTYGPLGKVRSAFSQSGYPCDPFCPLGADGICINYQGQIQAAQLYQSAVEALNIDPVWSEKVKLWINHLHINHSKYEYVDQMGTKFLFYGDYEEAMNNYEGTVNKMELQLGKNGFWKLQLDLLMSINKSGVDVNAGQFEFSKDSNEYIIYAKRAYDISFSTYTRRSVDWALAASAMLYSSYLYYDKKYGDAIKILTSIVRCSDFKESTLIYITLLLVQCHFKHGNYSQGATIAQQALNTYSFDNAGEHVHLKLTFLMGLMKGRLNRQDKLAAIDIFKSLYHKLVILHPDFMNHTILLIREVMQLKLDLCTEQQLKNLRTLVTQSGDFKLDYEGQSLEDDIEALCQEVLGECKQANLTPDEWADRHLLWGTVMQVSSLGVSEINIKMSHRVLKLFKTQHIEKILSQKE